MKKIITQVILYGSSLLSVSACGQILTYDQQLKLLYNNSVPRIQPATLSKWMQHPDSLILLDIRSEKEYTVSHIRDARFVDYESFEPARLADLDTTRKVVVYCSVGYRSERIGEKLGVLGFDQVYNLYGGIFQWKNQGHKVVNPAGQVTDSVHTYNKRWGKWLKNGEKVYE